MNADLSSRLSARVDKLLSESSDRLQVHLGEQMALLEEKGQLAQDVERLRQTIEETEQDKVCTNNCLLTSPDMVYAFSATFNLISKCF